MELKKTLFFEIPNQDFIMPVYTEDDVNTLKSFLQDDDVQFSVGYKSLEDEKGFYYIGRLKQITDVFRLKNFPLIYRKRVLDILKGLCDEPQTILLTEEKRIVRKIVYFRMTKNGPKVYMLDDTDANLKKLKKRDIYDYYIKEIPALVVSGVGNKNFVQEQEIFYQIKNPNY